MGKHRIRNELISAEHALRKKRLVTLVYFLLRFAVILIMVAQFFNRNFENVFLCGL